MAKVFDSLYFFDNFRGKVPVIMNQGAIDIETNQPTFIGRKVGHW
jgi:hypothetical protein